MSSLYLRKTDCRRKFTMRNVVIKSYPSTDFFFFHRWYETAWVHCSFYAWPVISLYPKPNSQCSHPLSFGCCCWTTWRKLIFWVKNLSVYSFHFPHYRSIVFVLKKISTPFTVYINRYIIIKRISNLAESNARELLCGVEQNDD